MRYILVSQRERKSHTAQPQQHLSPTSHTLALTYTPAIPLNVTSSAERSIDAKGSEALGSILHHFSQLGHIYSPQVIVYLRVILSAFLASLQMSQGPGGRGRQSEIKMKREEGREWERNEGRGSSGKESEQGRKSERDHLRFTEWMKYDGVLPWVITDESGYKTAHCPKWLICPAAWRHKSWLSY